ncbi:MAG: DUF4384 domain-containing protein [bacterium]
MLLAIILSLFTVGNALDIDIWVDKEDGIYYPNEKLTVYFQVDRECYLAVYDIETGGGASMLFPLDGHDGWVEAGRTYQLPSEDADYDYIVGGSEGIETIIAVGSIDRLSNLEDERMGVIRKSIEIYIEEPEPALLRIISTPKSCQIYITEIASGDEVSIGKTPRTIALKPGEYLIEIKKFGFKTLERRIWLEPGDRRRVFVKLR